MFRVLRDALAFPWKHPVAVLRIAAIPVLVLVASSLALEMTQLGDSEFAGWSLFFVELIASAWLAIGIHRLVLLGSRDGGWRFDAQGRKRAAVFTAFLLATWLLFGGLGDLLYQFGIVWLWESLPLQVAWWERMGVYAGVLTVVSIAVAWFFSRICLLFPAVAVDERAGLVTAWRLSRGNVWRLAVITSMMPVVLLIIVELGTGRDDTLGYMLLAILQPIVLIAEVAAVSLSYAFLTAPAPLPTDPPA